MASQTQGIHQLLQAEKQAKDKLAEAKRRTWMNLETIILSKLTQEQKMKYCIFSLIGKGKQLKQAKEEAVVETDQYRMQTDKEFRLKQLRVITQMKQKNKHQGRYENLMDTTVSVWNA
uniref:V-type proton ATPase subunit G 3 isoform X1 n=1 Tax=Callithrix jacchus TaxID=9483 RepID=UPI0004F042B1|nr:V-type proton ATPase subunit G 3 isoform X1 [Callithrix jacchus]